MLIIKWWNKLSWTVKVWGSKNASLPIIAWALLIKGKLTLKNVPEIWDVFTFIDILNWIWVKTKFENNILEMDSNILNKSWFDLEKMKKIRVSILLLAPLLQRLWKISIPTPGWCNLWKRPVDSHLNWLRDIWYEYNVDEDWISLEWKTISWDIEISAWLWVTSTENLIVANVLRNWKTTIKMSAIEPHVMNLIDFLRTAWANIHIRYDHTIIVEWVDDLKSDFEFDVISDYIQSWTYIIMWALASKEYLDIENARIDDLFSFIEKLRETWVKIEDLWNDKIRVYKCDELKPISIQTNIFPGFPTDLQSPFAILMSMASGQSNIHEVLFEWRLNWLVELEKMWWHIANLNPHQAIIFWPTPLKWALVTSWDLRAWSAMVIAWLIAKWETRVTNVKYIFRWYENFVSTLKNLWADIEEVISEE